MILEFLESWSLFSRTYISALLIGASLSLMGVVVVARGNVFVAAAVAQASMLGVALSLFFGIGLMTNGKLLRWSLWTEATRLPR